MYRDASRLGNRLAPQRDEINTRNSLDEERKRARQEAMLRKLSSKPNKTMYGGGY